MKSRQLFYIPPHKAILLRLEYQLLLGLSHVIGLNATEFIIGSFTAKYNNANRINKNVQGPPDR